MNLYQIYLMVSNKNKIITNLSKNMKDAIEYQRHRIN